MNQTATRKDPLLNTETYTYDNNGNLATFTDTSGTTTYTWNARNQLTAISGPSLTATFTYDSFGRRTGKTINATTTNFVYDGLNPVQEKAGATVNANLLTGLGIDEFFTRTDGVGVRSLLPDALGSTIALGDGTGTLQTQYTYEPFGMTTQTGAASTSSYKYTGREDDGSGLMYYRARYYQPRLQRFIAEDPIGFQGRNINLYEYANGNPVLFRDPIGKIGGAVAFGGAVGSAGPALLGLAALGGATAIALCYDSAECRLTVHCWIQWVKDVSACVGRGLCEGNQDELNQCYDKANENYEKCRWPPLRGIPGGLAPR